MSYGLPGLIGIDHVSLTVPDLEEGVRFYSTRRSPVARRCMRWAPLTPPSCRGVTAEATGPRPSERG